MTNIIDLITNGVQFQPTERKHGGISPGLGGHDPGHTEASVGGGPGWRVSHFQPEPSPNIASHGGGAKERQSKGNEGGLTLPVKN